MEKHIVINWFNSMRDVRDTLQWLEDNTDFIWVWYKILPTYLIAWEDDFHAKMFYLFIDGGELNYASWEPSIHSEVINFQELLNGNWEAVDWEFYRYVYVSDNSEEQALKDEKRHLLVCTLPWKWMGKYIMLIDTYKEEFKNNEAYNTISYEYIARIPVEESTETLQIGESTYNKEEVEEALKNLKPIKK